MGSYALSATVVMVYMLNQALFCHLFSIVLLFNAFNNKMCYDSGYMS